jgi:hypothetical protein
VACGSGDGLETTATTEKAEIGQTKRGFANHLARLPHREFGHPVTRCCGVEHNTPDAILSRRPISLVPSTGGRRFALTGFGGAAFVAWSFAEP